MDLPELLKQGRLNKGLTITDVAKATGLDGNHINRIERGLDKPSEKDLNALGSFYELGIEHSPESIEVSTPAGVIRAVIGPDPHFPGIWISINGVDVALMEFNSCKDKFNLVVYNNDENDAEPSDIIYMKEEIVNVKRSSEDEQGS